MSSLPTRLVAVAVLKDMLGEAYAALKSELLPQMLPGDRQTAVIDVDGHGIPVGSVTSILAGPGAPVAVVKNRADFLAWCERNAPSELQTVVRPAFEARVLGVVLANGGWLDSDTGEVLPVDGIEITTSAGSSGGLMVKKSKEGPDLIRAEITAGRLTFADVLALPAGSA